MTDEQVRSLCNHLDKLIHLVAGMNRKIEKEKRLVAAQRLADLGIVSDDNERKEDRNEIH